MMEIMIKKIILAAVVVGVTVFSGVVGAVEVPKVQNDVYVYDGAGVIAESVRIELNGKLRELEKDTSAEIFVVTVDGLDGEPIEEFAYRVGNEMGIGQKEYDNGVLLLVSPPEGTRNVRIEVGKGMEGIFNDAKVGRMLDADFVPYRAEGDYQTGIVKTVDSLVAETRDNAEWVGKTVDDGEWVVFVAFGFMLLVWGFVMFMTFKSAYDMGKKELKRKGTTGKRGMWSVIAVGMALMNKNNGKGGWRGGGGMFGGGGGFSGGGGGGGSFGGGGATR
ncbi:MAG: TPM domain-containing protein [Candidatus Nomurabacteria bacterium]|nr:TPM domain-containing protein [Candidatus Nomurabacteria bacterium]